MNLAALENKYQTVQLVLSDFGEILACSSQGKMPGGERHQTKLLTAFSPVPCLGFRGHGI